MNYDKQSYKTILESALIKGFEFIDFFNLNLDKKAKHIVLRHDIDFSLAMALEVAFIDASYKIKSTFALQLSSPLYNPFSLASIRTIDQIQQLGHNIVLHHRVVPGQDGEEIKKDIIGEMQVMRIFFPYIQPVFVWHNLPSNNLFSDIEVPGMVNAYGPSYVQNMLYISDSVLRHSPEEFLYVLDKHESIHMLLHPIIWMSEHDNVVSMVSNALKEVIVECAKECILNPSWKERFPHGIPDESLNKIVESLS